jgi:hypothetical protein
VLFFFIDVKETLMTSREKKKWELFSFLKNKQTKTSTDMIISYGAYENEK